MPGKKIRREESGHVHFTDSQGSLTECVPPEAGFTALTQKLIQTNRVPDLTRKDKGKPFPKWATLLAMGDQFGRVDPRTRQRNIVVPLPP